MRVLTALMGPAVVAALLSSALVGCGRSDVLLREHGRIIGIALDGDRLAWATDGCRPHLFLKRGELRRQLPLPPAVARECFDRAKLVLADTDVGWVFVEETGNTGALSAGASSLRPRRAVTFLDQAYEIEPPDVGTVFGGIGSDTSRVLWGWSHVSFRDTKRVGTCDLAPQDPGCETRVDGGGVRSWSRGYRRRDLRLPPAAAIATYDGWIAIAVRPPTGWVAGAPRTTRIDVVRLRDAALVARIPAPPGNPLALTRRVLAVRSGFYGLTLYRLPSGRLLRRVSIRDWTTEPVAISGATVVLAPEGKRLLLIDAVSGRRQFATRGRPTRYSITAVAADASRVAWAVYDAKTRSSTVEVRRLR